MSSTAPVAVPVAFTPGLEGADVLGNYWLRQVTYRLRREVCWLWQERGTHSRGGAIPPFADKLSTTLNLTRYADEKKNFFANDETARYLTCLLEAPPPPEDSEPDHGSFTWAAREMGLDRVACFLLALGLLPVVDAAAGTVIAACMNDPAKTYPTLALAQRLWDKPDEILPLADQAHSLFRFGFLQSAGGRDYEWEAPLVVPALLARPLLNRDQHWPASFRRVASEDSESVALPVEAPLVAARLKVSARSLRIVPIVGARGTPLAEVAAAIAALTGKPLAEIQLPFGVTSGQPSLAPLAALAWLHNCDVFLSLGDGGYFGAEDKHDPFALAFAPGLPLTIFLGLEDKALLRRLPHAGLLPPVHVAPMTYEMRYERWRKRLPNGRKQAPPAEAIAECARRFRYERNTVDAIAAELGALGRPLKASDLMAACRMEATGGIGDLAQSVTPRFELEELMLPPKQARQIREIIHGMQALARVHYDWGTARAWNESGLCTLFAGPPGTGKTMAAEAIAAELDLPLYRIDLSQVVNKYIGETEKNLRRLFDAADSSDVILFFDEADALFGKRTEVKDAHDRYANLEISYLLERMERFKGLAVLATNRKQDVDEAFLRRLRFVVDFPLPAEEERRRMWRRMIPPPVEAKDIDFDFLARRFPLAGGHIRSIVFHACLQSAAAKAARRLTMPALIAAVKSEYEKLNRSISLEQFVPYEEAIERP